jgi:hypothetical protein
MGFQRLAPIHSEREDDPELLEAIDAFVVGLGEWIDSLQDAQAAGDLWAASESARDQVVKAVRVGYPVLAAGAEKVAAAAQAGESEATRKAIGDLIELVQRIRLGHRSAA